MRFGFRFRQTAVDFRHIGNGGLITGHMVRAGTAGYSPFAPLLARTH